MSEKYNKWQETIKHIVDKLQEFMHPSLPADATWNHVMLSG